MLIYSAIILHTIPACMLFRPLSSYQPAKPAVTKQSPSSDSNDNKLPVQSNTATNGSNNGVITTSKATETEPFLDEKPINKNLSKSKQSMYESTSSLYFGPHQDVPPEMMPNETAIEKEKVATENGKKRGGCLGLCCRIFEWSLFKNWLFIIYAGGVCCGHAGIYHKQLTRIPINLSWRPSMLLLLAIAWHNLGTRTLSVLL